MLTARVLMFAKTLVHVSSVFGTVFVFETSGLETVRLFTARLENVFVFAFANNIVADAFLFFCFCFFLFCCPVGWGTPIVKKKKKTIGTQGICNTKEYEKQTKATVRTFALFVLRFGYTTLGTCVTFYVLCLG